MVSPREGEPSMISKRTEGLALVVLVGGGARGLAADDAELHMLDLEAHEQEVDAADDNVLEVVLALAVLELDVQAVLDADVHLDAAVHLGRDAVAVDPDVLLADHVGHAARHGDAHVVAQLDVDAVVRLVLLLDVLEVEVEGLRVLQLAGRGQLLHERQELVVVAPVKEHFGVPPPIVPMNCDLDARAAPSRLPSFGRTVTAPLTDSPSIYSGAFSRRFLSSLTSTIDRSSASSSTTSISTGVAKK